MYYALDGAQPPPRSAASHATIYPYGPFEVGSALPHGQRQHQGVVMLGLQNEREWVQFCRIVLLQESWVQDERFISNAKRNENRSVLENMLTASGDMNDSQVRSVLGSFLFSGDAVAKPAAVLSGGEKTRLSLAMLVVSAANVLLLDEPTNNLDPASRAEILDALHDYEGAVVLVTHDEGAVSALEPERVLLLPDGVEDLWNQDYLDLISLA